MKIEFTDYERKILKEYMNNFSDYEDKDLTNEEYANFEDDLDDLIISNFDYRQESTRTSVMLQKIYDDIYWRHKDK